MRGQRRLGRGVALCAALFILGHASGGMARAEVSTETIRIGLISSLFRDLPEPMILAAMGPFRAIMESQVGLRGDLTRSADAFSLGKSLCTNKVQFGVFHGFEFAWAQKKFPALRPLVIAVNQQQILYAYVLVAAESPAHTLVDLKGKPLAVPRRTREHCYLFLERACQKAGKPYPEFFGQLTRPANVEDALDDVVDGLSPAVLVDGVSLDCFKRRKPGRFGRLRVLLKSTAFPAAVVAYHEGSVDEAMLKHFKTGMIGANKSAFGRQLLTLWQMTGFEKIPGDYAAILEGVNKVYPHSPTEKVMKTLTHTN